MSFCLLLIDDSEEDRATMRRVIAEQLPDCRVVESETGEEGLIAFRDERPDVVVLDYRLPDTDGLEMLAALVDGDTPAPVIVTTGQGDESVATDAMKLGAYDYLVKDVSGSFLSRLPALILGAFDKRQVSAQKQQAEEALAAYQRSLEQLAGKHERALTLQENRLRQIVHQTGDGLIVLGRDGRVMYKNPTADMILGKDREGRFDALFAEPDILSDRCEVALGEGGDDWLVVEVSASPLTWDDQPARLLTLYDITRRKRDEEHLRRLNRTYAVLSAGNHTLVRSASEPELMGQFCRVLVETGGYALVWVGMIDDQGVLLPVAHAGASDTYMRMIGRECPGLADTNCSVRNTMQTARTTIVRVGEEAFAACAHVAPQADFQSLISLPLAVDGEAVGVLNIGAAEADAFDADEVVLLDELAEDLAFGIKTQRMDEARRTAETGLRLRHRAIEAARNGVLIVDATHADHPIVYVNPAFERITGYAADEVLGKGPEFLYGDDDEQRGLEDIKAALRQQREGSAVLRSYRKDGELFWNDMHIAPVRDEQQQLTHFISILNDVTSEERYRQELERRATHDELTGLPNRNLMEDRLHQALAIAEREGDAVVVLFLDLDHFKDINDGLGHQTGDELLKIMAGRLDVSVARGDTVARYGGDEFVILLTNLDSAEHVSPRIAELLAAVAEPVLLGGQERRMTASVGASLFPRDGQSSETLLKNADAAMYRAKEVGRNNFQFFREALNQRILERLNLGEELRRALERGELSVHYQPQVDLSSGRVVGMEALARWEHPELGMVPPARFIPLAEDLGLIGEIGEWVLRESCRQAMAWNEAGFSPVTMAVNLSARQLHDPGFQDVVGRVLADTGLPAGRLELELTESTVMEDADVMLERLHKLKTLGLRFAIDDFGTGYSSLSHLKRFPFDMLKIDAAFVRDLTTDPHDAAIAHTIIGMAHSLGLGILAEGVETEGQLAYLRRHGCELIQGFYFSRPLPAAEATRLLEEGRRLEVPEATATERTLLILDDEPEIARSLKRLLRVDGYRVITATDPAEALELLAVQPVGVILCDLRMPTMTGSEFLARVKEIHPQTVRILLTGYVDVDTITEAVNKGWIFKFLTKPWDDKQLLVHIREAFAYHENVVLRSAE